MCTKVGIITLPLGGNYGGILQSAALYHFLAQNGFDVRLIPTELYSVKSNYRKIARSVISRIPYQNFRNYRKHHLLLNQSKNLILEQTAVADTAGSLADIIAVEGFDVVVVGSDQVWRWDYIKSKYELFFLDIPASLDTRRVAYAASFGTNEFLCGDKHGQISGLLEKFSAISVREESGINICNELGRSDCNWTLDPTFLPGIEFYESIAEKSQRSQKPSLVCYALNTRLVEVIKSETESKALAGNGSVEFISLDSKHSISDWLFAFRHAETVITDSFHGVVFSIIFGKRFVAVRNPKRGNDRFNSLLNDLGLLDRLLDLEFVSAKSLDKFLEMPIDFTKLCDKLSSRKLASEKFLLDAVRNA